MFSCQSMAYLQIHNLLPEMQSAYKNGHLTETIVFRVYSDLVDAIEKGEYARWSLLNLSAAFDTVDHNILLQRLSTRFGVKNTALRW